MFKRTLLTLGAAALAATLAACGGGAGGGSTPTVPGGGSSALTPAQQSEAAISTANALGTPIKTVDDDNAAVSPQSEGYRTETASGACANYAEFFAPDKNGDPNSTESILFYDAGCTVVARDSVRIFTPTGTGSETVARTTKLYAQGNGTPIATRTEAVSIANASFDANGFPKLATGFHRSAVGSLTISGVKTIDADGEQVVLAQSGGVNQYCSDAAGYNETGFPALGETFGWSGGTSGTATRTLNADGTVTWSATHAGTDVKGPIGSLSIATGSANATCPIATPMFSLTGGTSTGSYSIPVVATYSGPLLVGLTITNAQLANGATLNVVTNAGVPPTSSSFVSGTIGKNGTTVATFNVDAFGDGTLTVSATGAQYVIDDWHVVR